MTTLFGINLDDDGALIDGHVIRFDDLLPDHLDPEIRMAVARGLMAMLETYEDLTGAVKGQPDKITLAYAAMEKLGTDELHTALFGAVTLLHIWFGQVVFAYRALGVQMPMGMETGRMLGIKFQEELREKMRELTEEEGSE